MTQSAGWFTDVADRIFAGFGAHTTPAFNQFFEENGLAGSPDLLFIQVAYGFAPEPISPQFAIKRTPYANPQVYVQHMAESVERGWLEEAGDGQYTNSARATEVVEALLALGDQVFGDLAPLPDADLARIYELLDRVVQHVPELPEPAEKLAFSWAEKFDRGVSSPLMMRVRRRLLDLLAFRDDVHVAAWQPYEVDGQSWESLTLVWRGEARTAAELAEKLPYRNYTEEAYAAALQDLAARGWIAKGQDGYAVTDEGDRLRQEAEEATDRLFDPAWSVLGNAETEELRGLLDGLAGALKPPEEE